MPPCRHTCRSRPPLPVLNTDAAECLWHFHEGMSPTSQPWAPALTAAPSTAGMHTKSQHPAWLATHAGHELCGRIWSALPTAMKLPPGSKSAGCPRMPAEVAGDNLLSAQQAELEEQLGRPTSTRLVHCFPLLDTQERGRPSARLADSTQQALRGRYCSNMYTVRTGLHVSQAHCITCWHALQWMRLCDVINCLHAVPAHAGPLWAALPSAPLQSLQGHAMSPSDLALYNMHILICMLNMR